MNHEEVLAVYYNIFSPKVINRYFAMWEQPHRYYHNLSHLKFLWDGILTLKYKQAISEKDFEILVLAALFHDIVYDPLSTDNENQSMGHLEDSVVNSNDKDIILGIIEDTKHRKIPTNPLSKKFWMLDNDSIFNFDFSMFVRNNTLLFKEFQYCEFSKYKANRIKFLKSNKTVFNDEKIIFYIDQCIDYVENWVPKVGVFAGTFDNFHLGHFNILQKSEQIFDKVIIAQGINPEKTKKSEKLNNYSLRYKEINHYSGLITDYLNLLEEKGIDITLIRGLRNGHDLEYEMNQIAFMKDFKPDLKVVLITCDKEFEHISSTAIRNLEKINKKLCSNYLLKDSNNIIF